MQAQYETKLLKLHILKVKNQQSLISLNFYQMNF